MTIARQFTAVPSIQPNADISPWQAEFLRATKKNMDLLAGFQGATYQAVIRGDVTVNQVGTQGVTGTFDAADYLRVATELQLVRAALNELIININ